ncbi:MAG: DUF4293 family protein [Bacteroidales bacterium]|nr:DUF4293 family protein [Bacteroidales bacterium]MBQ5944101.1 DUF4293 family protein [Bacteroidales bacterium]
MWQRVQTLYLAIASALVAVLFFSVKAFTIGPDGSHGEEFTYISYFPYLILLAIIAILQVLALTTYKVRVFQMRTAVLAALLLIALQAWLAVDFFQTHEGMVFRYTAVFPIVACIFDFLAARGILADQLMVESSSHLRGPRRK